MKKEETKEFEHEVLGISRVERMTKGGRRLKFRSLVVSGDKKGRVGVGKAKGRDAQDSIEKALRESQKNIVSVPVTEGGTIPHEIKAKYGAAVVLLKPQIGGKGVVAGGTVRTICFMCGIKNISGKIIGKTRNKLNNAQATIEALRRLKIDNSVKETPLEEDKKGEPKKEKSEPEKKEAKKEEPKEDKKIKITKEK